MWKYKTQSLIGIFGLAFGLACFVPALYWLRYETSYDNFYPESEQIYRIYSVEKQSGMVNELVSGILDRKLQEQLPAMENSTVFFIVQDNCRTESMPHIGLRTLFSDSTFLNVFPQVFVSGDARRPLQILNNIVLTETVAIRMFGDVEKAVGQQINSTLFPWGKPYVITAVIKDPPPNTNVSFDAILYHDQIRQQKTFEERNNKQIWTFATLQGYVRFHPNTDIDIVAQQLRDFPSRIDADAEVELRIIPVSDVRYRLNTDVLFTLSFIRLFIAAGILLLFSALFNFMNLNLDIFRQRIHEFRQRAVHGAKSRQLNSQMMFEMACSILISLALGGGFVVLICPVFPGLLGVAPEMSQLIFLFVICGVGVMSLMLLVGFIVFLRISRLAIPNLSKRKNTGGQPVLRRMAVTLQLAVSVVFIVAALVVMMQINFVNHKDLGFDRNRIIQLSGLSFYAHGDVLTVLKKELASIPQIENFTNAQFEPQHNVNTFDLEIKNMTTEVEWPGKLSSENPVFQWIATDSRFAETFGLEMKMGKWYDEDGKNKIVLNEEAVKVMGLSEPIGSIISINDQEYNVVGVVNDFHTLSLRCRIYPTVFQQYQNRMSYTYVSVASGQEQEAIRRITAILPDIDASLADIHPTTLNELYDRFNYSEQTGLKIFSVLAIVCLQISLFGIYAVATASTRRRRKEIAIRKIVGAKVKDIILIFFREYTIQVLIAGVIALPIAYIAMNRWLQGYAYRINIPLWLLIAVILGVTAVVMLTVLGQVLKAANSNPGKVVKN
jgi:ABC-type transport system, involved in lipoprotein release, permease component